MKRLISGPITATVPITCSVLQASLSLALPCMLHACTSDLRSLQADKQDGVVA